MMVEAKNLNRGDVIKIDEKSYLILTDKKGTFTTFYDVCEYADFLNGIVVPIKINLSSKELVQFCQWINI